MVVKCPPWQRLRSALAPRQGAPDGSWRLGLHRGGSGHWAPQPLPRALDSVASKATDSTAFDHLRLEAPSRLGTGLRWAPEQRWGGMAPQCSPGDPSEAPPKVAKFHAFGLADTTTTRARRRPPGRSRANRSSRRRRRRRAPAAQKVDPASVATVRSNGHLVAPMAT